jgi:AAA domain, putative AbiEii toxin, Type IV TA system
MLKSLRLRDVGPASSLEIEFSRRLNVFTGDNGLGKSFLLDTAWWALTGAWAGLPAAPRRVEGTKPRIELQLAGSASAAKKPQSSVFDFRSDEWKRQGIRSTPLVLVIYARVDGGFSVWDPARNYWNDGLRASEWRPRTFHFSRDTLWNGLEENGETLCNGLIRDWVAWQNQPGTSPIDVLRTVLTRLSPSPAEPIKIGSPARLSAGNVKDFPTLSMNYGEVPLPHASAAMKWIVSLAYLVTWAWDEHKRASRLRNQAAARNMVLLFDEVESHLHPLWQRTIVPSLLGLGEALEAQVDFQFLATTHAPLVLASIEPHFDRDRDSLFLFEHEEKGRQVALRKIPWVTQGDAVGWLTSPIFGLDQARSREAETAIEAAEAFMRGETKQLPRGLKSRAAIQKALEKTLPGMDPFWPRWIVETRS